MSDETRWKRYAERKRFERAIAPEVKREREESRALDLTVGVALQRVAAFAARDPFNRGLA